MMTTGEAPMPIAGFPIAEVEELFDRIDENGDRSISFEEFSKLPRSMVSR